MKTRSAIKLLTKQIEEINPLKTSKIYNPDAQQWQESTNRLISNIWGGNSPQLKSFNQIIYGSSVQFGCALFPDPEETYILGLNRAEKLLSDFLKELQDIRSISVNDALFLLILFASLVVINWWAFPLLSSNQIVLSTIIPLESVFIGFLLKIYDIFST